jgi:DNA polymerase-3 subunit epsilon
MRVTAALLDLDVLVVDCQTTGASPAHGVVLELGWCVARASDPEREAGAVAHWITPPPGQHISAQVRQLTGFQDSVLADALPAEEAWRRLRASMREQDAGLTPSAIHFARFELSFLRDWAERFEPAAVFPLDAVCVHAIACRLYPDLPRRNLRALAGFLGHGLHLERRSLGHVQATAFIWRRLVDELAARGVHTWSELNRWLGLRERSAPRKRRYPLPPARYRELPDLPGVYRMLRSNGDLLYVGKATSLKKRVTSHFTKQRGATERALEMLTQVSEIAHVVTSSALEAALLETETIKRENPPYNVQLLLGERSVWFASADFAHEEPEPNGAHALGPLSSRYAVRALRGLCELLADAPSTAALRAMCVGAPLRWAPDAQSFSEGLTLLRERHELQLTERDAASARRASLDFARQLLLSAPERAEAEDGGDDEEESVAVWDGPRVARHVERAAAQSYQVLRRAAWLRLLASSSVRYREPGAQQGRFLVLDLARIVEAGDLSEGQPLPAPHPRSARERRACFDAASYDALRILTTELKRILRDGGDVSVRLSRTRFLLGAQLRSVLRLV